MDKNMISSQDLALAIFNDLDQNGYTSAYDDSAILGMINDAANFVCAYAKRPWTLTSEEILLTAKARTFTAKNEIFYPYSIYLDEQEKTLTDIPILPTFLTQDGSNKAYVIDNTVHFSEEWLKVNILYHKWWNTLTHLWTNDMFFSRAMFKALQHIALWFIYPSWLDIGSSLANQHFQMAKTILDTYAKAYWFNIQPKKLEAAGIYSKF